MFKMKYLITTVIAALFFISCGSNGAKTADQGLKGKLIIFHAGSLTLPMKELIDSFKVANPQLEIMPEAAGSIDCARKITELKRDCDIMASADYKVIDKFLIPTYASDNYKFATNEMAIVYTPKSKRAGEINKDNWYKILSDPKIFIGRADPNADPCGYRSVLTLQLAEKFYGAQNFDLKKLLEKDQKFIRPKEVDLLALLETASVDYIFLYKSVAVQHNLNYLELPQEINLSNPALNDYYSTAEVEVRGKTPGETVVMHGEAMVYGITIIKNSQNREAAEAFLKFVTESPVAKSIMTKMGQGYISAQ